MILINSKNNIPLRLTKEWESHIVLRHPEMDGQDEPVFFQLCTGKVKAGNEAKLKTRTQLDRQG